MKKISMRDIAKELGLSTTTVSFVINHKSEEMGISAATVKKVNEVIKKKGYKPNNAARVLRTGKSNTIALIVEDISNPFFGNVAKIIELIANKNGYKVFFSSTEHDTEIAKGLISIMKQSAVDGFIITATNGLEDEILKLKRENIPFVLIDRILKDIDTDFVIINNYQGGYQLTNHLITQGYKKIAFITIVNGMSQMEDRKLGYQAALKDASILLTDNYCLEVPMLEKTNEEQIELIRKFLYQNKDVDAIFFSTNYLGILGIEAIQQNNLTIGKDIAIVSFDDHDLFRLFTPSITVASQPLHEIGSAAIEILLKKLNSTVKTTKSVHEILNPEIIIRNSSPKVSKTK